MQEYEDLKALVDEIEADVNKAEGGNKAAGTRVRKQMQKIKQAAQAVRSCVLEIRSAEQAIAGFKDDTYGCVQIGARLMVRFTGERHFKCAESFSQVSKCRLPCYLIYHRQIYQQSLSLIKMP